MNKGTLMKKLTIITGANSGVGKAISLKLANEGYPLLLIDLNLEIVKKEVNHENIHFFEADVTKYDQLQRAIKYGEAKMGPIENMINNAGVMVLERADLQNYEVIARQNEININGVIFGTQIALQSMIKSQSGTIINLSSIAGIKSFENHSAYCGSKFAVRGYSETVRGEVADKNIRVSIISPGVIKTKLLEGTTNPEIKQNYETWRDENNAFIEARDIANIVHFILNQPQSVTIREIVVGPTTQVE
ncbi:MAG: SDR family NAD(P)-dependent oxidoreductase [Mycoplasmataceae bacterium]|nr:SDR family NAD(P)-dependent oxidoreductase [Mycoplasmataceae bacterium]